jgi:dienelactone hydrolase
MYIGGSSGGVRTEMAERLAKEGFVAAVFGYFGAPGLPSSLANIPVEYFEKAAKWLLSQPEVNGLRIGVIAVSRGTEIALKFASMTDKVGAIACYAPSSVLWTGSESEPSWTYKGQSLPHVRWLPGTARRELYERVLSNRSKHRHAIIEVEKITSPILLISGKDDQLWPSDRMASQIMRRLGQTGFSYERRHVSYPATGHRIGVPGRDPTRYAPRDTHPITGETLEYGGSIEANRAASEQSWPIVISFLRKNLR